MSSIQFEDLLAPKDEDIAYEEDVLRNPYVVKSWLRYFDWKKDAPPQIRWFLYERALKDLPGSYKIWRMYLRDRTFTLRGKNPTDPAWEATNNVFDRCLVYLHKMPLIWLDYCEFLMEQKKITKTRKAFDRALRSLPITQHNMVWKLYIKFTAQTIVPVQTGMRIYKRFLQFEPKRREEFMEYLIAHEEWNEAAHQLVYIVNDDKLKSSKGKTKYDLWVQLCDIISKHSDQVKNLKIDAIIRSGIKKFSDQVGKLWTTLADYYIRLSQFEKARDVFEEGMNTVISVKDFSTIWEAYAKFEDSLVALQMENAEEGAEDDEDFDLRIARYENLIDRQPLLINSVLLRQNPHVVHEWQKRANIYRDMNQSEKVVETYTTALQTIDPLKAKGKLQTLWANFAKFYASHDDIASARKIFEKGLAMEFKYVEDLASLYCEYAELELSYGNYNEARAILQRATTPAKTKKIGDKEPVQNRVYRHVKLWALYADLEESLGTFMTTKTVYEKMIDLRATTPIMIINYANFLEEHKYFEESFKAYEKGIALFKFPVVFDVWVQYLTKFVERYGGKKLERARELFEQVIEQAPASDAKIFYIMYANLEEEFGLARRAMLVYDRATRAVADEDKFAVFSLYINRAAEFFGVTRTREIYEKALEVLPAPSAKTMCLRFAELEKRLGEIDRARAIYAHGSQFTDPNEITYWQRWRQFEVEHGNEDTFREMLRVKRTIQAQSASNIGVLPEGMAANFVAAGTLQPPSKAAEALPEGASDMEMLERLAQVQASLSTDTKAKEAPKKQKVEEVEEGEEGEEVEAEDAGIEQMSVPKEVFDRNVGRATDGKNDGAKARLMRKRKAEN